MLMYDRNPTQYSKATILKLKINKFLKRYPKSKDKKKPQQDIRRGGIATKSTAIPTRYLLNHLVMSTL